MAYGCMNRPAFRAVQPVQDGYYADGTTRTPRMADVRFVMSPTCQYTLSELGQADTGCAGCKHRSEGASQ